MATHQVPFQDANQIAGFIYHHADHVALRMGTLHNKERGAVKMHTLLDYDSLLPEFVNITEGKCGDNRGALDIPVPPHSVVVTDRGYCDFSLLDYWDSRNVFFVVRHRDNLLYSQIEERLLPETRAQNVLIDEIIELTGEQTKKKYTRPLRRIAVWNDEHGYVVQLLTNNFKLTASTIAQLYKARWMIEILQKHQAAVENKEFHWYITQCC